MKLDFSESAITIFTNNPFHDGQHKCNQSDGNEESHHANERLQCRRAPIEKPDQPIAYDHEQKPCPDYQARSCAPSV
jgi:hypothetical protein